MIEYILRKFCFNEYSKNDQDIFLLLKYEIILHVFLGFVFYLAALLPVIFLIVSMYLVNNFVFGICVILYQILYSALFLILCFKLKNKIHDALKKYTSKLYFYLLTMKGNAITKKDFNKIKSLDSNLYNKMYMQNCAGFCYCTCFEVLNLLKKGTIRYYRIRAFEHEQLGNKYTMHAVYVNNGFIFDTYSSRQYRLKKFYKKFEADLMYGEFSYEDVTSKSYEEFMDNQYEALQKWCMQNDCFLYEKI